MNLLSKPVFTVVKKTVKKLQESGIEVSLFIEPDERMIDLACKTHADAIELNTNAYCECTTVDEIDNEFLRMESASNYAAMEKGLTVNAGHGLNYDNVEQITYIDTITELNIGHSIVAESVYLGMEKAVAKMRNIIEKY